jgi:hypothetical protein
VAAPAAPKHPLPAPLHKKRESAFLHAILSSPRFSSTLSALLASAGARYMCAVGSPAFIAGGAPHQCIWPIAHSGGTLSPLVPLPFPQLPLVIVIWPPSSKRPFAPAIPLVFRTFGSCAQLISSIVW